MQGLKFDFIDTSNIADPNYMGVRQVIEVRVPLQCGAVPLRCDADFSWDGTAYRVTRGRRVQGPS